MNEIPKIDLEKTRSNIVEFINSKVNEANCNGIVIGLSGGIDSTLVAYLACEALGKDNVLGLSCHPQQHHQKILFMELK